MKTFMCASLMSLATLAIVLPGAAVAGEPDFRHVLPVKDPFKDLPGVKSFDDGRLKSHLDCDTDIAVYRHQLQPPRGAHVREVPPTRQVKRVYTCRDGNAIFQSTTPPVDYDWGVYKDHYK